MLHFIFALLLFAFLHPVLKINTLRNELIEVKIKFLVFDRMLTVAPSFRYAAILFKKQRYISTQNKHNMKIVCKDNFKYQVHERAAAPNPCSLTVQQLAEEYWRIDKIFLVSFPILFFVFNIIYWCAFIG